MPSSARTPIIGALVALALVAAVAGCGGAVRPPKPNPSGDAAFLAKLTALCAHAPALAPIDPSLGMTASATNAQANLGAVQPVQTLMNTLTRSLSPVSPLTPALTDLSLMLTAATMRYTSSWSAAEADQPALLERWSKRAAAHIVRARADLRKLGIGHCFGQKL